MELTTVKATCIRCNRDFVRLADSRPVKIICPDCMHDFAFDGLSIWAHTDRYQLYTYLHDQDAHDLANKVIEDWVNGKE